MSEKKSFVIKVKYPTPNKALEKHSNSSNMITEWNFRRIGLLLGFLSLILMVIYFAGGSEDKKEDLAENPPLAAEQAQPQTLAKSENQDKPLLAKPAESLLPAESTNKPVNAGGAVVRALLTTGIEKNEPLKTVSLPLKIGRKETLSIYYFAELKGMKGKTVIHEWYLNDQPVSQKKVNISSNPWRTSSKQGISYTMNNDWKVRLIDESGKVLNEKNFNLELK